MAEIGMFKKILVPVDGSDAATRARIDEIYRTAQGAGGQTPESITGALDFLTGKSGGQQYMNPYQQQVIDAANAQWDRSGQMAQRGVGDSATRAGAFGGSRHGVAAGVAAGENERNRNQQISGLLQSGFQDATQRAMAGAGLGMEAGNPDLWKLNVLKRGFTGLPYGTTYDQRGGRTTTGIGASQNVSLGFGR